MKDAIRAVQLDLDVMCSHGEYHYDDLVNYINQKVVAYNANLVYLQCFVERATSETDETNKQTIQLLFDPDGDIEADILNDDIFVEAIEIIKDHLPECTVLAWAPTLSCAWLTGGNDNQVKTSQPGFPGWYKRATPFSAKTHDRLCDLYRALGASSEDLDGVLFHDDLYLTIWEDVSEEGRDILDEEFGVSGDNQALRRFMDMDENADNQEWKRFKVDALNDLSDACKQAFKEGYEAAYPETYDARQEDSETRLCFARNIYSDVVLYAHPKTGEWFGQSLEESLERFDQVVVMAYYYEALKDHHLTLPSDPCDWLANVVRMACRCADELGDAYRRRLVFKLQSVEWHATDKRIPSHELRRQADTLLANGAEHIGFYPAFEPDSSVDLDTL